MPKLLSAVKCYDAVWYIKFLLRTDMAGHRGRKSRPGKRHHSSLGTRLARQSKSVLAHRAIVSISASIFAFTMQNNRINGHGKQDFLLGCRAFCRPVFFQRRTAFFDQLDNLWAETPSGCLLGGGIQEDGPAGNFFPPLTQNVDMDLNPTVFAVLFCCDY
jgi:hypothetical protein